MFSQGQKTPAEQNAAEAEALLTSARALRKLAEFPGFGRRRVMFIRAAQVLSSCVSVPKAGGAACAGGSEAIAEQSGAAGRPPLVTRGEQL